MKKILLAFVAAICMLSTYLSAAETTSSALTAATDATTANNCSMLPADQQTFASQLNASNKMMFCNQFSPDQRMSAVNMMGTADSSGTKMTADQAVSKVATMHNITPMQTAPQKGAGGCPVR